jgi:hypothetical protein
MTPQLATSVPKFILSKDFISTYANHVFFNPSTTWDMRIVFGEVAGVEDKQLVVENRVSVTMPLAVAKILAMGIEANLEQYAKTTGRTVDLSGLKLEELKLNPMLSETKPKEPPK